MSTEISERGEQVAKLVTEAEGAEAKAAELRREAAEMIASPGIERTGTPSVTPAPPPAVPASKPSSHGSKSRRTVRFRHTSTHAAANLAWLFANQIEQVAKGRDNLAVEYGDRGKPEPRLREDGTWEIETVFVYGPVIGGYPSDGEKILDKARAAYPPLTEQPLQMEVLESEPVS